MRRSTPSLSVQVFVEAWPEEAFRTFVEEVGFGLRQAAIQPERGRYLRFNQDLAGRFVEFHDAVADTGVELGRVTAWEPGAHLAFGWRQPDWPEGASTEVDVRFAPVFDGTLLSVEHAGFERLGLSRAGGEYRDAWNDAVARRPAPGDARRPTRAPRHHAGRHLPGDPQRTRHARRVRRPAVPLLRAVHARRVARTGPPLRPLRAVADGAPPLELHRPGLGTGGAARRRGGSSGSALVVLGPLLSHT